MPLGMEVDLDPSDIVLHGDPAPAPPKRKADPPIFGRCLSLLWTNVRPSQLLLSTCFQ